jgi:hypothetical protein
MTVTIVETRAQACAITGGVDTHADVHVACEPLAGRNHLTPCQSSLA